MTQRNSPSGPVVSDASVLRWFATPPNANALAQTGVGNRGETGFSSVSDPIGDLSELEDVDASYAVQVPITITQLAISFWPGDAGVVPSGDADFTWQIQTFNPVTNDQADLTDAVLSFGPGEYGSKKVSLSATVSDDLVIFVRGDFPTNWDEGTQNTRIFIDVSTS